MRSDGTEMSNLTGRTLVGAGGFHSDLFRLFDKGTEVSQKRTRRRSSMAALLLQTSKRFPHSGT